jgi:hypothetical protein
MMKIEERRLLLLPKLQLLPKVLPAMHPRQMELVGSNSCQVDADSAHLAVLDMLDLLLPLSHLAIREDSTITIITSKRESHVNISFGTVTVRMVTGAIILMYNSWVLAKCRIGCTLWNYCRITAFFLIRSFLLLFFWQSRSHFTANTLLCI